MTIALRPVAPADRAAMLGVHASTWAEELARSPWDEVQRAAFVELQFDLQDRAYRAQRPAARFDVILVGGQVAGRLSVDRTAAEIRVIDIVLLPAFRGRGVGGALLAEITEEADRSGTPVTMHVQHGNPARRLYERLGFREAASDASGAELVRPARAPTQAA